MRSFITSTVLALAALPAVLGVPVAQEERRPGRPPIQPPKFTGCSVLLNKLVVPLNQTKLVPDASLKVQFVGLGVGTQNYTCGADSKYASAGALAKLYDVSCVVNTPFFKLLPDIAFRLGGGRRSEISAQIASNNGGKSPLTLGDHFFRPKAAGGIEPVFDFTSSQGTSSFVVAAKKDGIPSPLGATKAVDLLQLNKVEGTIGTQVFRMDTRGGVAPTSCTPAQTTAIPYVAVYWFLG